MSKRKKDVPCFPYEPVVAKVARYAAAQAQLRTRQADCSPVSIGGRNIVHAFWGRAWCDHMESWLGREALLRRGRTDLRYGAVLDLRLEPGLATALVADKADEPFAVRIGFKPPVPARWQALKEYCSGKIVSLPALLQGRLPAEVRRTLCHPRKGVFPAPREITLHCTCSDSSRLCQHLAAVVYGIAARLDAEPRLLFTLRGVDEKELVGERLAVAEPVVAAETDVAQPQEWTPRMISALRRRLRLTQVELGRRLGVSGAMVSFLERGSNRIKASYLPCLQELFVQARALPRSGRGGRNETAAGGTGAASSGQPVWTASSIRALRQQYGLNQDQFGKLLEVGGGMVSYLELRGDLRIGLIYQQRLQELVEMPEARRQRLLASVAPVKAKKVWTKPPRKKRSKGNRRKAAAVVLPDGPIKTWEAAEIVALRRQLQLSQQALGRQLGVSAMTVSNWERGKATPNAAKCVGLSALAPA